MQTMIEKVLVPNFDELQAGRELDAFVAEKVMGFKWRTQKDSGHRALLPPGPFSKLFTESIGDEPLFGDWDSNVRHYSTDIASAWKVVEKMQTDGHCLEVRPYVKVSSGYRVGIWEGREMDYATGETAPLAICRAALKALYLYTDTA